MPVTPFHFGPGGLIKVLFRKGFSFKTFVLSQILIDLEPYTFLLKNEMPEHRVLHTYLGSNLVLAVSAFLAIYTLKIGRKAAVVSAAVGAYSHVFLDSLMHADMRPLAPFAAGNPFLGKVPLGLLHGFCLLAGAVAVILYKKGTK